MAEDKKLVEAITSMDVDFAQWYTDVCKKAELMSYSSVKGCMIFKPAGYAIWENIRNELDRRFKEAGVENVYMPMFIPESLLEREKDHVEGFAPEVAWVTYGGLNPLQERMCVRPTSETLFCDFYKDVYRQNCWCLEITSSQATKYSAIQFLRTYGSYDYVTGFGDSWNDISLFQACDESYAVANASSKLKAIATATIKSNIEDGVADFLSKLLK